MIENQQLTKEEGMEKQSLSWLNICAKFLMGACQIFMTNNFLG